MYASFIFLLASASAFMSLAFIPNLAKDVGATDFQLGLIISVYGLMSFISYYLFGRWGDVHGVRKVLRFGLVVATVAFATQAFATNPATLFAARAFAGFSFGMVPAALIAYAHHAHQRMGHFSRFESLGWLTGSILAGILSLAEPQSPYALLFIASSLFFAVGFASSIKLPDLDVEPVSVPLFPVHLIAGNLPVYLGFFLRHFGAMIVWTFFSLFLWELGASFFWIGILNAANVGTQALLKPRLDGLPPWPLFRAGLALAVVVFYGYSLAPTYLYVLPVQVLLGVAWSLMQVGALTILVEGNLEHSTVVGLLYSTHSLANVLGPFAAGVILSLWGFTGAFYAAAFFAFLGFIASYLPRGHLNGQT